MTSEEAATLLEQTAQRLRDGDLELRNLEVSAHILPRVMGDRVEYSPTGATTLVMTVQTKGT